MLIQHTLDRLREMGLHGMAQALDTQRTQPDVQGLAFEDRLGLLVDQEWTLRQNRRLTRLLQEAKLRYPTACLEDNRLSPPARIRPRAPAESRHGRVDPRASGHARQWSHRRR